MTSGVPRSTHGADPMQTLPSMKTRPGELSMNKGVACAMTDALFRSGLGASPWNSPLLRVGHGATPMDGGTDRYPQGTTQRRCTGASAVRTS